MKRAYVGLVLLATLGLGACAAAGSNGPVAAANVTSDGLGLKGFDPVGYFDDGKPEKGDPNLRASYKGVTYYFATEAHRQAFTLSPAQYVPEFGGYCAYAISNNAIADIDPTDWAIVDHKLYLNNNGIAQSLWAIDETGNIKAGNENWQKLPKHDLAATDHPK